MKQGDPVTVVICVDGRMYAAHARVGSFYQSAARRAFYFVDGVIVSLDHVTVSLDTARATGRFFEDEGVTWTPGHRTDDDVVTLLAAAALAGTVPTELFDSEDYSSVGWRYDLESYMDDDHPVYKEWP